MTAYGHKDLARIPVTWLRSETPHLAANLLTYLAGKNLAGVGMVVNYEIHTRSYYSVKIKLKFVVNIHFCHHIRQCYVTLLWRHGVIATVVLSSSMTTRDGYYLKAYPLQWLHNGRGSVSNHQPHDCLLNRWFRRRSNLKKTSKPRVTGLCAGNSPGTGEFPAQMASNAENVSIWWRHHDEVLKLPADLSWLSQMLAVQGH